MGGNAALFSTLKCLVDDHDFTLVVPVYSESQISNANELARRLPQVAVRAVYCGQGRSLVQRLTRAGSSLGRKAMSMLRRRQIAGGFAYPYYPFLPLPRKLLEVVHDELQKGVDICQAESAPMMPLGTSLPADVRTVFVHYQIHSIYTRRFIEAHGGDAYSEYLAAWMNEQELAYLKHFSAIIAFSDEDKRLLQQMLGVDLVFTSSFPVPADVEMINDSDYGFDGRFLFLGSEIHDPNVDALRWLLDVIWPQIKLRLPGTRLEVIGSWGRRWKGQRGVGGVTFTGFVPNLNAALRGGIMLVPLRIGSGIRTKILAALAQGIPVVSTPVGAEGLLVRDGEHLLVQSDPESFATEAIRLAKDAGLRRQLGNAGLNVIREHYSAAQVRRRRNEIYRHILCGRNP
jgi:glycosyltransferase involved in cell wall biosynthesis